MFITDKKNLFLWFIAILALLGCARHSENSVALTSSEPSIASNGTIGGGKQERALHNKIHKKSKGSYHGSDDYLSKGHTIMPDIRWNPSFTVKDVPINYNDKGLPPLKVGADIFSNGGTVAIGEVMSRLTELKGFSLSWANDVDQTAQVAVNIRAKDDYWKAIDNILRQQDYFFKVKGNTIFIKYKDTRRFYLPIPFLSTSYSTNVGGDLIGSSGASGMVSGTVSLGHTAQNIDIWQTLKENLDKILNLATMSTPSVIKPAIKTASEDEEAIIRQECKNRFPRQPARQNRCIEAGLKNKTSSSGKGENGEVEKGQADASNGGAGLKVISAPKRSREGFFYTIDRPLGIITVTAPRSILEQVKSYLDNLNRELSKQVIIEAKILEVRLERRHSTGVDWTDLMKNSKFSFNVNFGSGGQLYPKEGVKFISSVSMQPKAFTLLVDALSEYGKVKVLSNPKLTLMNGQAAMLTVGESISYIDNVESTVDSVTGIVTYTVNTQSILSGIGFSVMAQIAKDDEVVLHITPVTSQLQEPIEYRTFGSSVSSSEVGLPRINLREISTMAKVKNGQFLIIGGLIDEIKDKKETKVPVVGDIPVIGNAFKSTKDYSNKRELIILLRPQVVKSH